MNKDVIFYPDFAACLHHIKKNRGQAANELPADWKYRVFGFYRINLCYIKHRFSAISPYHPEVRHF